MRFPSAPLLISSVTIAGLTAGGIAQASPPGGDPDGWQELAAMGLVEWGAVNGLALSTPACTQPNSAEVGEPITCYATADDGTVLAFVTEIPASGAPFEFARRPEPVTASAPAATSTVVAPTVAAPTTPGVQPPAGYPGTETTTTPTAPASAPAPGSEAAADGTSVSLEPGVDPFPPGEVLDVPVPDTGPDTNFASPVPLGETADLGAGWTMSIDSVLVDAGAEVAASDPDAPPAPEKWQYVVLTVTMGYDGDPAPEVQSGVDVYAIGDGVLYGETGYVFYDGVLTFDDVPAPGETVSGDKVFLVPAVAADSLVVFAKSYRAFDLPFTFLATS